MDKFSRRKIGDKMGAINSETLFAVFYILVLIRFSATFSVPYVSDLIGIVKDKADTVLTKTSRMLKSSTTRDLCDLQTV